MTENEPKKRKFRWLKIMVSVCFLIVGALWLDGIYFRGFTETGACRREKGFFSKLVCATSGTYEGYAVYLRSLPSDEEMIANFYKHRADFERLVHIYRQDLSIPMDDDEYGYLLPTPDVKAMMDRIDVAWIKGDRDVWMPPDPYFQEPDVLKHTAALSARGGPEARKYSGVIFGYAHADVHSLRYLAPVYKDYYYTPSPPRVENGLLRTPSGAGRIMATLNSYPLIEYWGECFYRRIEPHWFLRFCQDK